MRILGIETSCDETSAAVADGPRRVLSNLVHTQIAQHQPYGGVVPEVAARSHVERLPGLVEEAMRGAGAGWNSLDAVAVTSGPGLATSLLVGVAAAKALAIRLGRPLYAVHHLDGHLYSVFLDPAFPEKLRLANGLALLVSGGHTSLVQIRGGRRGGLLGATLDDAAGEALDKGAKLLGLGYPGGPAIEAAAAGGDPARYDFPRGLGPGTRQAPCGGLRRDLCFSFSGLKTALLYHLRDHPAGLDPARDLPHVAASYQEAVVDALIGRVRSAAEFVRPAFLACAGGVARNRRLRAKLGDFAAAAGLPLMLAPPEFCTDNAGMIAAAAAAGLGCVADPPGALEIHPTWPLPADDRREKGEARSE
ncbi:MAG: tRNA (adenosine(37)-N6)-threonylcarbamoyltransferase complex transferase subunit TsaD [Verrucomicrobia bacterium]|nr:tRNA (adenosine(37)-N6)-threonylcarbamoyltransferase complex transferase subunit TsaD [Verrucomicrobiota bacterium]